MVSTCPFNFRNLTLLLLIHWTVSFTLVTSVGQETPGQDLKHDILRQLDSLSGATFGEDRQQEERSADAQSQLLPLYFPADNGRPLASKKLGSRYKEDRLRRQNGFPGADQGVATRSLDSLGGATFGRQRKRFNLDQKMNFDNQRKRLDSLSGLSFGEHK